MIPLITVITPTFNRAKYLAETIDSVLNQNYPNLEYLILDDGSTDNTKKILKQFSAKIIYKYHKNIGETKTVNQGLLTAKGKYILILSSDDLLLPGAIEDCIAFLEKNPKVLAVYPDWQSIDKKGNLIDYSYVPNFDYQYMFSHYHCLPGPGTFFRKQVIDLIGLRDEKFKYVADFDYWLRLGLRGKIRHFPKVKASFRVHSSSQSVTAKNNNLAEENIQLINKIVSLDSFPRKYSKLKNQALSAAYYHSAQQYQNILKSIKSYLLSFILNPKIFFIKLRYEFVKLKKRVINFHNNK